MIRKVLELRSILKNKKLSASELEELRDKRLRAVVRNAYDHVPYYRSIFRSAGLSPDDIRSAADLTEVPVTTKDDLRAAGLDNIVADWADVSSLTAGQTSGATGKPFTVYRTTSEQTTVLMINMAALISIGFRPRDRVITLGWPRLDSQRLYHRLGLFRREVIPLSEPMSEQIRILKEFQPTILHAVPSALRVLMHYLDRPLHDLIDPRIVVTGGEVCDDVLKQTLRENLDAELFNFFAAQEFGRIAWECPSHDGLHINSDHFIVESLDERAQAFPGKPGSAVVTNLFASAMPLIRYNLGDVCELLPDRCSCGSALPLMNHPLGRAGDVITLPGGKMLSPWWFSQLLHGFKNIDQWRLVQETPDHFVLQLTMRAGPEEGMFESIRTLFLGYMEEPVKLDIQLVDYMDEGALKFRTFISKVPTTS